MVVAELNLLLFLVTLSFIGRLFLPVSFVALAMMAVISLKVDFIFVGAMVHSVRDALAQTFQNDVGNLFWVTFCKIHRL